MGVLDAQSCVIAVLLRESRLIESRFMLIHVELEYLSLDFSSVLESTLDSRVHWIGRGDGFPFLELAHCLFGRGRGRGKGAAKGGAQKGGSCSPEAAVGEGEPPPVLPVVW